MVVVGVMLEGGTLAWLLVCIRTVAYEVFYLGEPCECSYIVAGQEETFRSALVNLGHKHRPQLDAHFVSTPLS